MPVYGLHLAQGVYPIAIIWERVSVISDLLEAFIFLISEQPGLWNFLVLILAM